ncbi:MAG: hypothetical protein ACT4OO_10475 [Nitrospiraceae bacterium]
MSSPIFQTAQTPTSPHLTVRPSTPQTIQSAKHDSGDPSRHRQPDKGSNRRSLITRMARSLFGWNSEREVPVQHSSQSSVGQISLLEASLERERQRGALLKQQCQTAAQDAVLVRNLDQQLRAAQEQSRRLAQRLAQTQTTLDRMPELEADLTVERETARQLVQQLAEVEQTAARVPILENALVAEWERSRDLQECLEEAHQETIRVKRQIEELLHEVLRDTHP